MHWPIPQKAARLVSILLAVSMGALALLWGCSWITAIAVGLASLGYFLLFFGIMAFGTGQILEVQGKMSWSWKLIFQLTASWLVAVGCLFFFPNALEILIPREWANAFGIFVASIVLLFSWGVFLTAEFMFDGEQPWEVLSKLFKGDFRRPEK